MRARPRIAVGGSPVIFGVRILLRHIEMLIVVEHAIEIAAFSGIGQARTFGKKLRFSVTAVQPTAIEVRFETQAQSARIQYYIALRLLCSGLQFGMFRCCSRDGSEEQRGCGDDAAQKCQTFHGE